MMRETGEIPQSADVVILGAGIAGHCAALAAAEAGAQVLLLEKASQPGGSSAMAGGGFVFVGTDLQKQAGYDEDAEYLRKGLFETGKNRNNPVLVDAFVRNQHEAYAFLVQHGAKFKLGQIDRLILETGTGRVITNLHMAARAHPNIIFASKCAAMKLGRDPDSRRVTDVTVAFGDEIMTIAARRAVVLATGGFSRSRELLGIFAPELLDAVKHGGVANTGDGIMMACDLGAGLADLGYVSGSFGGAIRNYPHGVQGADEVPPLLFSFVAGGIMVNAEGKRFVNEGQTYKALGNAGMAQTGGIAFQIFDNKVLATAIEDSSVNNYQEGIVGGYIRTADTIADLAACMQLDPVALEQTIERYNADVRNGIDSEFGRTSNLLTVDTAPFCIAASANALTTTYGGITTNGDMAVVDWMGEPISGLFAAGEVVGGFHGAGYFSGTSLSSSATFGMLAGRAAAACNAD
ncbi:MAG TPA: FAD-dependent oxidoreductase [Sphingobium sp.]|nr:FAD-dependent oxidoreductase [Sphingobium sp.]